MNLALEHSVPIRALDRAQKSKWPLRIAVPFILAASAGLWVGLWKLGSLVASLI
jgi:hypothetical protein